MIKRLDFMRPSFIRVMDGAGLYCLQSTDKGRPEYAFRQGPAAISKHLGGLLGILDYALSRGVVPDVVRPKRK